MKHIEIKHPMSPTDWYVTELSNQFWDLPNVTSLDDDCEITWGAVFKLMAYYGKYRENVVCKTPLPEEVKRK